jgi:hypothetical protein
VWVSVENIITLISLLLLSLGVWSQGENCWFFRLEGILEESSKFLMMFGMTTFSTRRLYQTASNICNVSSTMIHCQYIITFFRALWTPSPKDILPQSQITWVFQKKSMSQIRWLANWPNKELLFWKSNCMNGKRHYQLA